MARLKSKPGRKSNYLKSLNNDYHREVRRRAFLRDGFQCRDCHTKLRLELHHLTYYINGESIVGKELDHMECVITLCENCHQKRHGKKPKQ